MVVGGHLKTNALLLVEWSIYHGLKWCLSRTKVLIIPSEEELPAHYLPGNNNADTRPPAPPVSPVAACQLQHHSFNLNKRRAAGFIPVLHYLSLLSAFLPTLPRITSPRSAGCPPPSPAKPSTLTSSHSASLRCPTPPPLLVLMSHCEIQADGWGTKG